MVGRAGMQKVAWVDDGCAKLGTASGECLLRDCLSEGCWCPGNCVPGAMCSVRVQLFLTNDAIIYTPQSYLQVKPRSSKHRPLTRRTAAIMAATSADNSTATEHTDEAQLTELLSQEAGRTSEIELKVIRNTLIPYTYKAAGKEVQTEKVEVIFQSKIPEQY